MVKSNNLCDGSKNCVKKCIYYLYLITIQEEISIFILLLLFYDIYFFKYRLNYDIFEFESLLEEIIIIRNFIYYLATITKFYSLFALEKKEKKRRRKNTYLFRLLLKLN